MRRIFILFFVYEHTITQIYDLVMNKSSRNYKQAYTFYKHSLK